MKGLGSVKDWGKGRRVRRLEEGQWAAGSGGWGDRGLGSQGAGGYVVWESGESWVCEAGVWWGCGGHARLESMGYLVEEVTGAAWQGPGWRKLVRFAGPGDSGKSGGVEGVRWRWTGGGPGLGNG